LDFSVPDPLPALGEFIMSTNHDTKDIQQHIKVYMMVFAALAALTVVTVAASYLDLSSGEAILLALTIASIKGSLVASYFMHLISEKALITWILMLTAVFFFILMFIPMTSFIDQARLG
jgi:cytochrome c oxidase subunit 4